MAAVYRTLYEKYEQNDVLHVGIQEVVEAEKEIDGRSVFQSFVPPGDAFAELLHKLL